MWRALFLSLLLTLSTHSWGESDHNQSAQAACLVSSAIKISHNPIIEQQLIHYNKRNINPHSLDTQWPSFTEDSNEVISVLHNPARPIIENFIKMIALRGEGLLIGHNGGLVAATNFTSDYWQGDEEQFLQAINLKPDTAHIIEVDFDHSAKMSLTKISIPIYSSHSADLYQVIGVLVIGFDSFVMDFREYCLDF